MAKSPEDNTRDTGRRAIVAPVWGNTGPSIGQFLVVWACSTVINVSMIAGAFLLFSMIPASAGETVQPELDQTTEVADASKEYDLTNTDFGDESKMPLAYDVERIEDVSVPGQVDPTAAPGVEGAPEAAPMNVPPPPGSGGGFGGAPLDPNISGTGMLGPAIGGMGGIYNPGSFGGRSGA